MKTLIFATVATIFAAVTVTGQPLGTLSFQPTTEDFVNPERGFYHYRTLTSPFGFDTVRPANHSLIYGRIPAQGFRDRPLSQAFLNQIQAGFNAARAQGIKVKPRVVYNDGPNDGGGADAPKSIILGHIQQLQPLFQANKDVIYVMDAGFIGQWGEWHSSTNGLDNTNDRTEILSALLDALPVDRMVGIRTPHFKRAIYNGSPINDTLKITSQNAFDGTDLTRVGHLNDCFLASPTDFGTYNYTLAGWSRAAELSYIGGESRFAPHGGETCAQSSYSNATNAIFEMEQLHTDYLNVDYNTAVLQDWVNAGKFDEISRRLGYRFELTSGQLDSAIRPSGVMQLQLELDNVGFGELFNPRDVEVTLKNAATGSLTVAPLQIDPRLWSGGTSNLIDAYLSIPADLPEGSYSVGLRLPDKDSSIRNDVRFSIRFANAGIWDASTGINLLKSDLQITHSADGPVYANIEQFQEVDLGLLQPTIDADFDRDGDLDGADIDGLVATIVAAGNSALFDLDGNSLVDGNDLQQWLADAGNNNLPSRASYRFGDANLDGNVDITDFSIWNSHRFTMDARWTAGDFNADGAVDLSDFHLWNSNRFTANVVPEPEVTNCFTMALLAVILLGRRPF